MILASVAGAAASSDSRAFPAPAGKLRLCYFCLGIAPAPLLPQLYLLSVLFPEPLPLGISRVRLYSCFLSSLLLISPFFLPYQTSQSCSISISSLGTRLALCIPPLFPPARCIRGFLCFNLHPPFRGRGRRCLYQTHCSIYFKQKRAVIWARAQS